MMTDKEQDSWPDFSDNTSKPLPRDLSVKNDFIRFFAFWEPFRSFYSNFRGVNNFEKRRTGFLGFMGFETKRTGFFSGYLPLANFNINISGFKFYSMSQKS